MRIPLLLHATPRRGLKGPTIPVVSGKWRVISDLGDSIAHIQYNSPQPSGVNVVNGCEFELEYGVDMSVIIGEVGKEESISIYIEEIV